MQTEDSHVVHIACTIRKLCQSGRSVRTGRDIRNLFSNYYPCVIHSYTLDGLPDDIEYWDTDLGYRHAFTACESLSAVMSRQVTAVLGRKGFARRFLEAEPTCEQVLDAVRSAVVPEQNKSLAKKAWREQLRQWRSQ